jgi:hypothetical protein
MSPRTDPSNVFNYDWFTGPAFQLQKDEARRRCAGKRFPDLTPADAAHHDAFQTFLNELEVRVLLYLRDGFSYEMKEMVDLNLRSLLTFECEPIDDQYKVGAFVVSLLFEEVVRVEVFAVHPSQKPEDMPIITGFRAGPSDPRDMREDPREPREPRRDPSDEIEEA